MRRLSWRGCEGSPYRLPGVVHVVGQACGNAPAGNDRSRIGSLAGDPRPPRGEVAVDDVGVEGDDSVDARSAENLGRWYGGLDGQHGWPDDDRHRRPPEQEKMYCASSEGRHFDVCIVVCDGLKGLPEAVNTVWDRAVIQTCVIHYSDTWVMPTFLTLPLVAAVPAEQMSA